MKSPISLKSAGFLLLLLAALGVGWIEGRREILFQFGNFDRAFFDFWSKPLFHLGETPISMETIAKLIVFLILLAVLARQFRRLVRTHLLDRMPIEEGQRFALERTVGYVVFLLGLIIGLQTSGVNLSTLTVLGGAVGIGIGFGMQTIANNFISGLILLFERPVKVGDRVEVGSLNGDVLQIGARSTWVRTNDNIVVILPNSEFIEKQVTNWTANDRRVRFAVPLGVSYGSDPEHVREVLLKVAAANSDVLRDPPADVIFIGFGDSSLDFELRVWTATKTNMPYILRSDLYFAVFKAFKEQGIEIPFPQRDLHLKSIASEFPGMPPRGSGPSSAVGRPSI